MNRYLIGGIALLGTGLPANAGKPDIILIVSDQQTASAMSCAGNPFVKTPGMDALAADGTLFERAYVSYPLSGPSRASLFTGKTPWELGVKDNDDRLREKDMRQNLGYRLADAGYECLYAGKWHVPEVNMPESGTGFRKICNMNDPALVDSCKQYIQKKSDKPLFLVASFLNPHEICEYAREESLPYGNIPDPKPEDYPDLPVNFAIPDDHPEAIALHKEWVPKSYPTRNYTEYDWRKYLYAYYRLVERVDREIVRLIEVLKENGRYENSLVVFVSDHGDGVAAHQWNQKRILQEEVIRVPFVVKTPESKTNGKRKNSSALINTSLDIYPTICDFAGAAIPDDLQGKSLKPVLEGKRQTHHEQVVVETLLDGVNVRAWSVVESDYKYVLYQFYKNREQLFQINQDKLEMRNLSKEADQQEPLDRLRRKLYQWGVRVNDPRLIKQLKPYMG